MVAPELASTPQPAPLHVVSPSLPGNPAYRRKTIAYFIGLAVLGTFVLLGMPMFLGKCEAWILADGGDPTARLALLTRVLGMGLFIALLIPAALMLMYAQRIAGVSRELLPGDMEGSDLAYSPSRAWLLRAMGIMLALLGGAIGVVTWWLAASFAGGP